MIQTARQQSRRLHTADRDTIEVTYRPLRQTLILPELATTSPPYSGERETRPRQFRFTREFGHRHNHFSPVWFEGMCKVEHLGHPGGYLENMDRQRCVGVRLIVLKGEILEDTP